MTSLDLIVIACLFSAVGIMLWLAVKSEG